jgi:hypothetical protein
MRQLRKKRKNRELRGVGKNMRDHLGKSRVSDPMVGAQTANERSRGLPLAGGFMRWLITGKSIPTYSPSIVAASVTVLEESATPDKQCMFTPRAASRAARSASSRRHPA